MSNRKRPHDDDNDDGDTRMSRSPSTSPSISSGVLPPSNRPRAKRARTNLHGRPLALPRLLETLNVDEMRDILRTMCDRHQGLGEEIVKSAPRPSVASVLVVLTQYESRLREAFPVGRPASDYAYNRVRRQLIDLLEALKDYTPSFLPPNEPQTSTSLEYLDNATELLHRLPDWESNQHNRHKWEAYEEISKAWAIAIKEAAKRGGGIQLQFGGWDQKLSRHNERSGNRLEEAMKELRTSLGWISRDQPNQPSQPDADAASIRQQLLNGTYGLGGAVRVGPW
jgi:protein Cut8